MLSLRSMEVIVIGSDTGTVKNNHVIIESGAVIDGYVEGGAVTGSGIVEGNIVIVDVLM